METNLEAPAAELDCLIIGGGPAGLTAALYFARFRRRFLLVDAGASRAAWIPESHNLPFFADGISGPDILRRQRDHAARYGVRIQSGTVEALSQTGTGFQASIAQPDGTRLVAARHVLLCTGAKDIEPDLPNVPDAVQRGLVRYCPICDGYESKDRHIAVLGRGAAGLGEASFIARTYARNVTLLTMGEKLRPADHDQAAAQGITVVEQPITSLKVRENRIAAITPGGAEPLRFDVLYSALGLDYRTGLALALGARHDQAGTLIVDDHYQTSVKRLYAAGAIVRGLDQIVIAMGHAAVAATAIHNRCALPTEDEG